MQKSLYIFFEYFASQSQLRNFKINFKIKKFIKLDRLLMFYFKIDNLKLEIEIKIKIKMAIQQI